MRLNKRLVTLILFITAVPLLAQKLDTAQINSLIKRGMSLAKKDRKMAIDTLSYALKKSEEIDYYKGKSNSLRQLGFNYLYINDAISALDFFDKAIELRGAHKDSARLVDVLIDKVYTLNRLEKWESAITVAKTSIMVSESIKDSSLIMESYFYLNDIYLRRERLYESMQVVVKALGIAESLNDTAYIAKCNQSIGLIYDKQGDLETAIKYFEDAKKLLEASDNKFDLVVLYNDMGIIYKNLKLYSNAMECYEKGLKITLDMQRAYASTIYYVNIVTLYNTLKEYDKAYDNIKTLESLLSQAKISRKENLTGYYNQKAITYLNTGRINESLPIAITSTKIAKETNDWKKITLATKTLAEIYEKLNKLDKALEFQKEYIIAKDSMNSIGKTKDLANLEAKFEFEKKNRENLLLKKEAELDQSNLKRQKIIIYTIAIVLLVVAISAIFYYRAYLKRKRLYEQIDKDKLVIQKQAEKLKALDEVKSRFFANISHDLRSPLTLILGNTDLILSDENSMLSDAASQYLKNTNSNGLRLLQLIEEINELILLEDEKLKLKYQPVKIYPYLELLVKLFSSAVQVQNTDLTFNSIINKDSIYQIDTANFEKIIFNLISNAIKHSRANDKITVSLALKKEENSLVNKDLIEIKVADTGEGIPQEDLNYIFDRYYQSAKKDYKAKEGLGLGLALVKEIVTAFKGEIVAESELGEGSVFTVILPLEKVDNINPESLPEVSAYFTERKNIFSNLNKDNYDPKESFIDLTSVKKNGSVKILVVDDHPEVREYISSIINKKFSTLEAKNGEHALKILKKEKVDLIITDLMMPWLDGFGLLEELKKDDQLNKIPVFVVSARTTDEDKMKVLDMGVNEFISKPFNAIELLKRVSNLINKTQGNYSNKDLFINFPEKVDNVQNNILKKIEATIINRIADNQLSVLDLADEIATSERQLYRLVKDISGFTPKEYIKEVRFQYVRDLIKKKSVWTVGEAAKAIGMQNTTYFTKQFEKRFNQNPKELLNPEVE